MSKRRCEDCAYWALGDQTPRGGKTTNIGNCTYFLYGNTPVDVAHGRIAVRAPYWVQNTLQRTISWQGEYCDTWTDKEQQP